MGIPKAMLSTKKSNLLLKLPTATKHRVKLGMCIIHEKTGQEQIITEFGLRFWKTCHPIERNGWRIKTLRKPILR